MYLLWAPESWSAGVGERRRARRRVHAGSNMYSHTARICAFITLLSFLQLPIAALQSTDSAIDTHFKNFDQSTMAKLAEVSSPISAKQSGLSLLSQLRKPDVDAPTYAKQTSRQCPYPCNCTSPQCKAGVSIRKDGCNCCFICTRQQGDICDAKDICDEEKGLYCDLKLEGGQRGICRAKAAKPCTVDNNIYKDGEEFKLNCSQLCTCQNGQYACSTLCPQEDRAPSAVHCKDPILVKIDDRCCREWVCPHSHSLPGTDNPFVSKPTPTTCKKESTEWSACSQTCDMGVSIRVTNDNDKCETMQERRLCYVRPCGQSDIHLGETGCKSTWKSNPARKLIYGECESVLLYTPKYCSTCKKQKCCGPGRTKTRKIQFKCPEGKVFTEKFMWIKNCQCFKTRRCPFK